MIALLLATFLVWFRVAWEIQLESYDPRYACVFLWYNIFKCTCLYGKPVHTSLSRTQLHMTTKLFMTSYCTPNERFTFNDVSLYKDKLASYTIHFSVSFQLIVYSNVKITKRYYCTSSWFLLHHIWIALLVMIWERNIQLHIYKKSLHFCTYLVQHSKPCVQTKSQTKVVCGTCNVAVSVQMCVWVPTQAQIKH